MPGSEVNRHLVGASFGTRKHPTRRRFTSEPGTRAHGQPRQSRESVLRTENSFEIFFLVGVKRQMDVFRDFRAGRYPPGADVAADVR